MKTINQKMKAFRRKRYEERIAKYGHTYDIFDKVISEGKAYKEGMTEAFRMIEHEIDLCAINGYKFPILHIRDFIDKMLERKETK